MQGQPDFVDGTAVDVGAEGADIFQDIDIGERLAGIEKEGIVSRKAVVSFSYCSFIFSA